jgi:FKBP-type peptidyl-prolyl cis-trans isomerase
MKASVYFLFIGTIMVSSCRNRVQEASPDFSAVKARKNETLIKMNNYVARRNQDLIKQFVKRTSLEMSETGSGLWFGIYKEGNGILAKEGNIVNISYVLRLLDGTVVDSATITNPKTFRLGKGGVEPGLEEGMLLLRSGDHARFILPPHLAFGNFGDQKKIPPGAFLFYDLYLLGVKP